jgi:ABC-type transporter Mla subunit MlaD
VVAAEVRNLAQRSAAAAKEIKGLIQDSVRKVETGSELVNKSGQTLEEIVRSVRQVTGLMSEIAATSQEQSTGIEQVSRAVAQIDSVVQQNAAQTEEISSTAQALTGQALSLQSLIGQAREEISYTAASRFREVFRQANGVDPSRLLAPRRRDGQRKKREQEPDSLAKDAPPLPAGETHKNGASMTRGGFEEF